MHLNPSFLVVYFKNYIYNRMKEDKIAYFVKLSYKKLPYSHKSSDIFSHFSLLSNC